ncbi:hypothetical protein V2J09_020148, partial [Rumex salicifolius]
TDVLVQVIVKGDGGDNSVTKSLSSHPTQSTQATPTSAEPTSAEPESNTTAETTAAEPTTEVEPTATAETTAAEPTATQVASTITEDSASIETSIRMLCKGAMYKEACEKILLKVATGKGNTAEVIKAGVSVALDMAKNIFELTDTFVEKINSTSKPETTEMAVDDCKSLFQESINRLEDAFNQFGEMTSNSGESGTFRLRLWLSDVLTFFDSCMDTVGDSDAHELQDVLKGDVVNATQVTMTILDVFTSFTKALSSVGFELNANKIHQTIENFSGTKVGSGRRLLGGASEMIGEDGAPRWLSAADRRLLNLDNEGGQERKLAGLVPNAVVALDGSGQFKSIQAAVNAYNPKAAPLPPGGRYVIYVKAGVYDEYIVIPSSKKHIYMYGDGPTKTIITGNKSNAGGVTSTSKTASFAIEAPFFFCRDMAFENTAGAKGHQAVALRANNEQQIFLNCHFNGYQDTLYPQGGSQFFRDCVISGTVDFIFGNGATIIQSCTIIVRMPMPNQFNAITAQGRTGFNMPTGLVLQDCIVNADPALDKVKIKTYLGRPWKEYARTVFMENNLGDMITPIGYNPFDNTPNTQNSFYGEFGNIGPGSATNLRAKWPHIKVLTRQEAQAFTVAQFLPLGDDWLKADAVPHFTGFKP